VRLRNVLLLILVLPALVLGSGWSLRFCAERLLGTLGCCTAVSTASCCPDGQHAPQEPVTIGNTCARCCIDITTLDEQPVPTPEPFSNVVERTQAAALAIALPPLDVPAPAVAHHESSAHGACELSPAVPGRCTPLPLRI